MLRSVAGSVAIALATVGAWLALAGLPVDAPALAAAPTCRVPGVGKPLDAVWRPDMASAIAYQRTRTGDIAFAVRTDGRFYGYRPDHQEWSASIVKVMLMVVYLDQPSVAGRALDASDRALLGPMITQSNNDDAQVVFDTVGQRGLRGLANRVGMADFATNPVWGETGITAADQTEFMLHPESYIAPRHRAYAMGLLASIIPSERWGIGEVAPKGWQLYFKGGWGYGTGLIDSQVALLTRGCARVSLAVLTMNDGSHAYGKATLEGIFERLLKGIPS